MGIALLASLSLKGHPSLCIALFDFFLPLTDWKWLALMC